MKTSRLFPTLLGLASLIVPGIGSAQQPPNPPPLVTTTGSVEVKVAADFADLSFEVEVRNADLAVARKEQAERAAKVLAAMRGAGIADKDLGTTQTIISTSYTDRREETAQVQYYSVQQRVSCTLHNVTKVPDLTAVVVAAGATRVNEAMLQTSELRKYKDEARRKAVVAAREKATLLATELGAKIGRPYSITESNTYGGSASFNSAPAQPESDGATVENGATYAAGLLSISATVQVSFVLE